jgi:hypothetical protein
MASFEASIDAFVATTRRSGLVNEAQLEQLLREWQDSQSKPFGESLTSFTTFLIGRHVLTAWQVSKLRENKFKGYFLDEFVLIDHLDSGRDSSRYLGRNCSTGQFAIVTVHPPGKRESRSDSVRYDVEIL